MKNINWLIVGIALFFGIAVMFVGRQTEGVPNFKEIVVEQLASINDNLIKIQKQIEKPTPPSKISKVTLTAYHPNSRGTNSDKNPRKTATMKRPLPGKTLAISTELFSLGWLNKQIYIDGWGVGKATDRMKSTVKGKRIDICFPTLKSAKEFGIKNDVLAVILD